jgi:hypothetical protein
MSSWRNKIVNITKKWPTHTCPTKKIKMITLEILFNSFELEVLYSIEVYSIEVLYSIGEEPTDEKIRNINLFAMSLSILLRS